MKFCVANGPPNKTEKPGPGHFHDIHQPNHLRMPYDRIYRARFGYSRIRPLISISKHGTVRDAKSGLLQSVTSVSIGFASCLDARKPTSRNRWRVYMVSVLMLLVLVLVFRCAPLSSHIIALHVIYLYVWMEMNSSGPPQNRAKFNTRYYMNDC